MADLINEGMHGCSAEESYVVPAEQAVRDRLQWFQDQKLALMMHFGVYSQMGMCESWPISDGDAHWSRTDYTWEADGERFRQQYFDLMKSFNPLRFEPEKWARFAKECGFRYYILTTKHHDGFCLFDTDETDYKVTSPLCPFHTHRYADIVRHAFDAFRAEGIAIAPYFSKADWHCPWYWAKGMEKPVAYSRNPTYDPKKHPELWDRFVAFTHAQLCELAEKYGPVDILWLDGGQVAPQNGQDIRLDALAARLRKRNPGLLFADRTVGGAYENYITPEQSVPDRVIGVPWESCVSVGRGFAYSFDDDYKSPRTLAHLLISVVCRGGNLALNIAPQPDGRLPRRAMESARGLGEWLARNGEAIYGTRVCPPYERGEWAFTRKNGAAYAVMRLPEGETLGETLRIPWQGGAKAVVELSTGESPAFSCDADGVTVALPRALAGQRPLAPAFRLAL